MPKGRGRNSFEWTFEMRVALSAAVIVANSKWKIIAQMWASRYPQQAGLSNTVGDLIPKLSSQYAERHKKSRWNGVWTSPEDLWTNAPEIMHYFTAMIPAGIQPVQLSSPPDSDVNRSRPTSAQVQSISTAPQRATHPVTPSPQTSRAGPSNISSPPLRVTSSGHMTSETRAARSALLKERAVARRQRLEISRATEHGPFRAVPAELAHPQVPALLFRFYDTLTGTHVENAPLKRGFLSGFFKATNGGVTSPLHHSTEFLFSLVEHHVNRTKLLSPFISVSNDLFWTVTQALKKTREGGSIRVSIIDGRAAAGRDGSRAYHLKAYDAQLRERRAYRDGGWRPAGNFEFLIWGAIPQSAIVCDFAITRFETLCRSNDILAAIFRPRILERRGVSDKIRRLLQDDYVELSEASVPAIAQFLAWVYSNHVCVRLPAEDAITKLVSDLVQGWQLRPSRALSREEWLRLADGFVSSVEMAFAVRINSRHTLGKAFLFGVISGLGDPNWQYDDEMKRIMIGRAEAYGLSSPESMYASEEDPIIAAIQAFTFKSSSNGRGRIRAGTAYAGVSKSSQPAASNGTSLRNPPLITPRRSPRVLKAVEIPRTPSRTPPESPMPATRAAMQTKFDDMQDTIVVNNDDSDDRDYDMMEDQEEDDDFEWI